MSITYVVSLAFLHVTLALITFHVAPRVPRPSFHAGDQQYIQGLVYGTTLDAGDCDQIFSFSPYLTVDIDAVNKECPGSSR